MTNRPNGTLYVGVTFDIGRRTYKHRESLIQGGWNSRCVACFI